MLVLTRKKNETIAIGGDLITITVVEIRGDKVRIGIQAPNDISVNRGEIQEIIDKRTEKDSGSMS